MSAILNIGTTIILYSGVAAWLPGQAGEEDPLEEVVGGQMKYRYFPVNMGEQENLTVLKKSRMSGHEKQEGLIWRFNIVPV